jgi:hypothetical protein
VTPGQDGDPGPAEPPGAAAEDPPDHARAETYLRLRAEAELRRVQALPRPDPGIPAPLRGAARVVLPPGRRAASIVLPLAGQAARALQPLAENATRALQPVAQNTTRALQPVAQNTTRALQPLAGQAGRTLQPLGQNTTRALQLLAGQAGRTLQPLAGQVIGAVLPAADHAARRLHPLAWEAGYRLQALPRSAAYRLRRRRGRGYWAAATLRGTRAGPAPRRREPAADESPYEGVRRLRRIAHALDQAGVIDRRTADSVVDGLETALAARSRIDDHPLVMRRLHAMRQPQPTRAPAGPYLAAPVGAAVPAGADSDLAGIHLLTLVTGPGGAVITAAGQLADPRDEAQHLDPWPVFDGPDGPSVTDDRGNSYEIHEDSGMSDGEGRWSGILRLSPVPPPGTQWLDLALSPGSPPVRVDLARPADESEQAAGPLPAGSPAERMIDDAAVDLLRWSVTGEESLPGHDLSAVADIVTALEAVGALEPARAAAGRLVALAGQLGQEVPPALRAAAPPGRVPGAWSSVLENRDRRDGPRGVAPAAAVLPELDGTRFVLAGLRSEAAQAELHVMARGWPDTPLWLADATVESWRWSARDDQGRWHIVTENSASYYSDDRRHLQLSLFPPLHPRATSLEVTVAGRSGRATVTVPLDWQEPR